MRIAAFALLSLFALSACDEESDCSFFNHCEKPKSDLCAMYGNCDKPKEASCAMYGNCKKDE